MQVALLIPVVGIVAACAALCVSRASYYRVQKPKPEPKPRPRPARALSNGELARVLAKLDSEEFMDQAPAQVYAKLLEDGEYMCSTRTMYRVLADAHQVRERRAQRRHPEYKKPQLVATAPNQIWSWDTTKLPGHTKGTYFTLYVILDIFSRYIVGWQIAARESAAVAQELITACCKQQNVARDQLTIHADNGSPMVAKSTALLYVDLGIAKSHSRPYTSNDNPYSESNFRTIKYRPEMPEQLGSLEHARQVISARPEARKRGGEEARRRGGADPRIARGKDWHLRVSMAATIGANAQVVCSGCSDVMDDVFGFAWSLRGGLQYYFSRTAKEGATGISLEVSYGSWSSTDDTDAGRTAA